MKTYYCNLFYQRFDLKKTCVRVFLLCFIGTHSLSLFSANTTYVSPTDDMVLFHMLDLKINTAASVLQQEKKTYTTANNINIYHVYLDNWSQVLDLVLKEDYENYENYLDILEQRIEDIEEKGNKESPDYHILLAEIYSHAAMANIVYGDYFAGFTKLLKSNKNININLEKHPKHWRNNKLSGVLNVALDMMSPILKKIARIFNLVGDAPKGFQQLEKYTQDVEDYPGLKSEGLLYYGFALKLAKKDEKAYQVLSSGLSPLTSPALPLILSANVMYLTRRNDQALSLLSCIKVEGFEAPFTFLDYLFGKIKLNALDPEAAQFLERFLENSKLDNFKREIASKLSDNYYIHDNRDYYDHCRSLINTYSKSTTDRDREADVELKRPYPPLKELLMARYLINGGYDLKAKEILDTINFKQLREEAYKTEYYLLNAKANTHLKNYSSALHYSNMAIDYGKDRPEHYASEAALLAGEIEFLQNNFSEACKYWELAREIKGQNDVYFEQVDKVAKNKLQKWSELSN